MNPWFYVCAQGDAPTHLPPYPLPFPNYATGIKAKAKISNQNTIHSSGVKDQSLNTKYRGQ